MNTKVKALFAALCAITVLGFASCTKSNEELIIGKWIATQDISSTTYSGFGEAEDGTFTDTTYYEADEYYLEFHDNGTVNIVGYDEDTGEPENDLGTYTINDDKLVITSDGESIEFTIKKIDKKELQLFMTLSFGMGDLSMTIESTLYLKRA